VPGCARTMRLVASIPSSTGMRMSISTTSGRNRRLRLVLEDLPQSDADKRLVVGDQDRRHLIGSTTLTAKPPLGLRLASKRPS
jgi:hypothetical protein